GYSSSSKFFFFPASSQKVYNRNIYLFVHPVTASNSIYKYRPSLPFTAHLKQFSQTYDLLEATYSDGEFSLQGSTLQGNIISFQRTVQDYMFLDTLDSYRKEMAEVQKKQQPKKGSRGKGLKKDGTAFDSLNDETPTSFLKIV
ncbi:unnamed protein product, partial [Brassica oleracea var. botrytis]